MSAKSPSPKTPLPFGTVLGYAPGNVAAYSSDYKSADPQQLPDRHSYRHYENGIYTGYKWQCVEFARRWLLLNHGYVFDDIAMAYDIFRLQVSTFSAGGIYAGAGIRADRSLIITKDSDILPLRVLSNRDFRR